MSSVNKVILIGNLGRDPEVRTFPSGGRVVNLRIATSERWRDKQSGEQKERVEWHSVAIFNDVLGDVAEKHLRKGSSVYVEGQLETRKWQDQAGNDRYTTEIALRPYKSELRILGGRRDDEGQDSGSDRGGRSGGDDYGSGRGQGGGQGYRKSDDMDDEIPF